MPALQMLKFMLKKAHLDFICGWIILEKEMLDWEPEGDLTVLLGDGGKDILDKIICDLVKMILKINFPNDRLSCTTLSFYYVLAHFSPVAIT